MELIELYTREVGRNLPEKMRADIEKEIRSLIEDTLEDEARKAGRSADEEMLVTVLTRMGPPEKVAASYLPPRYLIGPELYPHFIKTLRVVLSIVAVLAALGVGLSLGARIEATQSIGEVIGQVLSGIFGALMQATAIVILVFAVIQFASPEFKNLASPWDPRKLRAEPDPERVSLPGVLVEIVMTVLALIVFNFYSHWIGISNFVDGAWVHMPFLTEAFFRYLPFLSLVWALQIGLNVWLAAQGRWTPAHRWAMVGVTALHILVLAWMLTGPAIAALPAETLASWGSELPADAAQRITEGLATSVRLIIGLVIALQALEAGKHLYKLLRNRLPEPIAIP